MAEEQETKITPQGSFDPYPWDYGMEFANPDDYDDPSRYCHHCGKEYEDWSDIGCENCDQRHPLFGTAP